MRLIVRMIVAAAVMVVGAVAPCVLSSRGDSVLTKLYSITLAALTAKPA